MKILPLILTCISLSSPFCENKLGTLIESDKFNNVQVCGEGKTFKENITIEVSNGDEKIVVEPNVNLGYSPSIFIGNFLDNGLEEVLYSVNSGGSGGYSFYQLFSFKGGKAKSIFDSQDFSPKIDASFKENDLIEINYQNKKLYLSGNSSSCHDDCQLFISPVNTILPYFNIDLNRYYLQVLQRIYAGFEANSFGYIVSYLEINEGGYNIIDVGTVSNFEY